MSDKKTVAVIGAGISGLCAAYWLQKEGYDVQVFEKSGHAGGAIITEREGGFLIDLGPNSTLETSEVLKELVGELGLGSQKIYANEAANKRYIVKNGELMPIPMSALSFLKTGLFSWRAKLRLLQEPFLKPTLGDDIALADFVRHRLGREFLDYAINPFVAGVYAGDPKALSTAAGFPKLYALEKNYGSLIRGALLGARERKKRKEVAKDRARMFSFRDGMQTFTDALAREIKPIAFHTSACGLRQKGGGFELEIEQDGRRQTKEFDMVVCCVPAHALAALLSETAPEATGPLADVRYPPVSVVYMAFKKEDIRRELDGFGFLIPEVENREILGSIWSSTIFPGRAPEGHVAFTSFVGGTRQPDNALLPKGQLEELVLGELKALVGISGKPVFTRIKTWEKAIPQYKVGYKKIQAIFDKLEKQYPGLHFAGNYRRGISVGDSVLSAHETVERIIQGIPGKV
ncbi:MAG: protoporphyrinogen oxidase [Phaeodactylibacter sp.]|nr:protoporphyrinogen oxidase [Phaeodactylibacter sp.]MCB9294085.1 protoporphyrinogen oxidase [Lewinellaceae bacterium]